MLYLFKYLSYILYLFIYLFICLFIYLLFFFFNYLFIRKLYLLEVMLLDWIIKLKRSITYVLLQIVYFQKVLNVSDMEYFMYLSMFRQFTVYNIVEEPGRLYLSGTLELSTFISKLPSLPKNFKLVSSWDLVPRSLRLYINDCFCLPHLNFTITLFDLFIRWQACKFSGTTLTPVSDSALQILSSKTSSWISAGKGFKSIISRLLYWEEQRYAPTELSW